MSVEFHWLVPDRLIYSCLFAEVTLDDMLVIAETIPKMTEAGVPLVHFINDGTHVDKLSLGITDLQAAFFNKISPSSKRGWSITVTPTPMLRFFSSLAGQFSHVRNRQVATMEEALAFLAKSDETLANYEALYAAYQALPSPKTAR